MLKPVSILTLDDSSFTLATAVQQRIAAACGLNDLAQVRAVGGELADVIATIHARRQAPDNPLRVRDDISNREVVLVMMSADAKNVVELAHEVRTLYEQRRFAEYFSLEALCLLPEVTGSGDYGSAYSLLKLLSHERCFDAVWLVDATNDNRVRFGAIDPATPISSIGPIVPPHAALDTYAQAIAGSLLFDPELSGAPAAHRPRGMEPAFSSFGYAELCFPRDAALQRLEPRLAAELTREKLLGTHSTTNASIAAKQLIVGEDFAAPLARLGADAGQSLFRRFQAKTFVNEQTRGADEVITAVRNELQAHRDSTHTQNLQTLATQGEQTAAHFAALLPRVVDQTLDREDYGSALRLLEALLDPLPDLRAGADVSLRNLVTELNTANAALDARLHFVPDTAASSASRKRIHELDTLLQEQQLVADSLNAAGAADQLAAMGAERDQLTRQLPDLIFKEEGENNAARNAAREAEAARLAEETRSREQQLRELFTQRPRAEQALREALDDRRAFIWRYILFTACGVAGLYFSVTLAVTCVSVIAFGCLFHYFRDVVPFVRAARETLQRINDQIDATDKSKNAAHNDELQFEYDTVHRRTLLSVLGRTREVAKQTLDALRVRHAELQQLADSFAPATIVTTGLAISVIDDADVDAWYDRTAEDRRPLFRELPVTRAESRRLPLQELRQRIATYAAGAFAGFRGLTLAQAVTLAPEAALTQRLKRFLEYGAPLVELREDDLQAQNVMQRDTTLWLDTSDAPFVALLRRCLPNAVLKEAATPLRLHALTRTRHYPGYVLGQLEYYRSQYDPAQHPDSAHAPDLLPVDLLLTKPVRAAYEQILLARALGIIHLREDGQLHRANTLLGTTHHAAAERLAASESAPLREQLTSELTPRLEIAGDIGPHLRRLTETVPPLTQLDRTVMDGLIKRYTPEY
ncbi:MAG TPA: hypothetical protein VGF69_10735 [Thermoanaerobaculia bacterium]|jgi:hypothetical protein